MSLEVLQKICRALNIPLDYIVNNTPCDMDVKIIDDIYEKITQLSRSDREVVTALLDALKIYEKINNCCLGSFFIFTSFFWKN